MGVTVALCLGTCGDPRGVGVSYERGTPYTEFIKEDSPFCPTHAISRTMIGPCPCAVLVPRDAPRRCACRFSYEIHVRNSRRIGWAGGGKAGLLIRKHDHFTPTRENKRHVRALARNHPEGWKLQGHVSPATKNYLTYRIGMDDGVGVTVL